MASKIQLLNANGKTLTIENGDTSNSDMNVRYFKTVLDEDGNVIQPYVPAGDRYGIRYEELLCFIISAI